MRGREQFLASPGTQVVEHDAHRHFPRNMDCQLRHDCLHNLLTGTNRKPQAIFCSPLSQRASRAPPGSEKLPEP